MTKHSQGQKAHEEKDGDTLSIELKARKNIALAKYEPYDLRANRFDDEQETFTSTMGNFLEGCKMTTKIALLLAERKQEMS